MWSWRHSVCCLSAGFIVQLYCKHNTTNVIVCVCVHTYIHTYTRTHAHTHTVHQVKSLPNHIVDVQEA